MRHLRSTFIFLTIFTILHIHLLIIVRSISNRNESPDLRITRVFIKKNDSSFSFSQRLRLIYISNKLFMLVFVIHLFLFNGAFTMEFFIDTFT